MWGWRTLLAVACSSLALFTGAAAGRPGNHRDHNDNRDHNKDHGVCKALLDHHAPRRGRDLLHRRNEDDDDDTRDDRDTRDARRPRDDDDTRRPRDDDHNRHDSHRNHHRRRNHHRHRHRHRHDTRDKDYNDDRDTDPGPTPRRVKRLRSTQVGASGEWVAGVATYYTSNEGGSNGAGGEELVPFQSVAVPIDQFSRQEGRRVEIRGIGTFVVHDGCAGQACKDFDIYVGDTVANAQRIPGWEAGNIDIQYRWLD